MSSSNILKMYMELSEEDKKTFISMMSKDIDALDWPGKPESIAREKKLIAEAVTTAPKKRGRPPKAKTDDASTGSPTGSEGSAGSAGSKPRGRPKGSKNKPKDDDVKEITEGMEKTSISDEESKPKKPRVVKKTSSSATQKELPSEIRFFSRSKEYKEFSSFFPSTFTIGEHDYQTAEHYFHAAKFATTDPEYAAKIRAAEDAAEAKKLGGANKKKFPSDWDDRRVAVMKEAVHAKFTQNAELRELLVKTASVPLMEASPTDTFWGVGKDGDGENHLGKILMNLRTELSTE